MTWNTKTTLVYKLDAYMYISKNFHYITSFRKCQFKGIVRAVVLHYHGKLFCMFAYCSIYLHLLLLIQIINCLLQKKELNFRTVCNFIMYFEVLLGNIIFITG